MGHNVNAWFDHCVLLASLQPAWLAKNSLSRFSVVHLLVPCVGLAGADLDVGSTEGWFLPISLCVPLPATASASLFLGFSLTSLTTPYISAFSKTHPHTFLSVHLSNTPCLSPAFMCGISPSVLSRHSEDPVLRWDMSDMVILIKLSLPFFPEFHLTGGCCLVVNSFVLNWYVEAVFLLRLMPRFDLSWLLLYVCDWWHLFCKHLSGLWAHLFRSPQHGIHVKRYANPALPWIRRLQWLTLAFQRCTWETTGPMMP